MQVAKEAKNSQTALVWERESLCVLEPWQEHSQGCGAGLRWEMPQESLVSPAPPVPALLGSQEVQAHPLPLLEVAEGREE